MRTDASKNKNDGKAVRVASPERKHLHMVKPHGRYIQNLTIDQLANERLTLLQQREPHRICNSGISDH